MNQRASHSLVALAAMTAGAHSFSMNTAPPRPSRATRELDDEITEIEAELVESDTFSDVHETERKEKELTRTYRRHHADLHCTNDDIKPRYHMRDFQPSFHASQKSDKQRAVAKQKRKARRKGQRNSKR